MKRLTWSRELPKKAGHYWQRFTEPGRQPIIKVVCVFEREGEFRVGERFVKEWGNALNLYNPAYFEWAGPIPFPKTEA